MLFEKHFALDKKQGAPLQQRHSLISTLLFSILLLFPFKVFLSLH